MRKQARVIFLCQYSRPVTFTRTEVEEARQVSGLGTEGWEMKAKKSEVEMEFPAGYTHWIQRQSRRKDK